MEYGQGESAVPLTEYERLVELGAKSIDLTLIYNAHDTAEDADQSTAHVKPDSVVFLEQFTTRLGGHADYEPDLLDLNDIRLRDGKESGDYLELKQRLLDDVGTYDDYVPKGPNDFTRNSMARLRSLLSKDCLIYYADYKSPASDGSGGELAAELYQMFQDNVRYIGNAGLPELGPHDPIGSSLQHLQASVVGEVTAHGLRESETVSLSLQQVGQLAGSSSSYVPRTAEGKIPTYILYGAAHGRSLTWQFNTRGVEPTVVEVMSLSADQYLDVVDTPGYNNYGRRLGYFALKSLIKDFVEPEARGRAAAAVYPHLEFLNEASREERRKFLVTCALIKRQQSRSLGDSRQWYESMLRSFMPNPQDYVSRTRGELE